MERGSDRHPGHTLTYAGMLAGIANLRSFAWVCGLLLVAGLAGMANMSSLSIAAQSVLPDWVRGRGLALVQLTFMFAFALGGAVWGALATHLGLPATLETAAAGLAANAVLAQFLRLDAVDAVDVTLAEQAEPYVPVSLSPNDGPVLLSVEYRIPAGSLDAFLIAVADLARVRRRDGAMHWGLYSDPNNPERHVETFLAPSWSEHLRTATRQTRTDADALDRVRLFHHADEVPKLTAMLGHKGLGHPHQRSRP